MTTRVVMEVFVSVVSGHLVILVYSLYLWHWPFFFFFFLLSYLKMLKLAIPSIQTYASITAQTCLCVAL